MAQTETHPVSAQSRDDEERSTAQLVKDFSEQTSHLVRAEARLAVREVTAKAKRGAIGGGMLGAAGITALYAGGAFVLCLIFALAVVLPGWAAALIVGGALLLLAGLFALVGMTVVRKASPPLPDEAIDGVHSDVETVKESAKR